MNRRVSTRCEIVAPTWLLMSSPMIGRTLSANRRCQGLTADEHRMALTKPTPAAERLLRVPLRGLLAAHGQVRDHDVDLAVLEDADHVGRGARAFGDDLDRYLPRPSCVMPRSTFTPMWGTSMNLIVFVLAREDRLGHVLADLLPVDVEGGHELDVRMW